MIKLIVADSFIIKSRPGVMVSFSYPTKEVKVAIGQRVVFRKDGTSIESKVSGI